MKTRNLERIPYIEPSHHSKKVQERGGEEEDECWGPQGAYIRPSDIARAHESQIAQPRFAWLDPDP